MHGNHRREPFDHLPPRTPAAGCLGTSKKSGGVGLGAWLPSHAGHGDRSRVRAEDRSERLRRSGRPLGMNLPDRALSASGLRLAAARGAAVALGFGLLAGCGGGTNKAALSPADGSTSGDGTAPTAAPAPATLSCRSNERVGVQSMAPPVGQAGGKSRPLLVLTSIRGVDPSTYQVVDRRPAKVEFIREDDRYAITVIEFPNGTWFEEKRQYCIKVGRPSDQVPAP